MTKEYPNYLKFTVIALGAALVIVAMIWAQLLLVPLAWAMLLSLMVLPIASKLEQWFKSRTMASIASVLIMVVVVGGILVLLTSQAMGLADDMPKITEKFTSTILDLRHYIDEHFGLPFEEQSETFKAQMSSTSQGIMKQMTSTLQHTLTTLAQLVIIPIYAFFLLNYRALFLRFVDHVAPAKNKNHVLHTMMKATHIVQGYLRGAAIEVVIVAIMVCILFLALGIKHALFFAVFVAVLNIIPYVGVLVGSTVSVLYAFATTDDILYPILVFVLLWVIQIIDNNFVAPFVVGQQIKINPLAILLIVVLGGMIWGVSGMIIFIPTLGMAKVILDESKTLKPFGQLLGDKPKANEAAEA